MDKEKIKESIRQRDGYRCTDCGISQDEYGKPRWRKQKKLDVHRLWAEGPYSLGNCVTLCRFCHNKKRRDKQGWDFVASVLSVLDLPHNRPRNPATS